MAQSDNFGDFTEVSLAAPGVVCIREHWEQKLNLFNFSWQGRTATDTAGRQAGFYMVLTE